MGYAFQAEGIKIGFYYSLLEWHHPDYTIDRNHPRSQTSDSAYAAVNKGKNMDVYREYVKNQVTELLTNYREVSIIWLDYSFTAPFNMTSGLSSKEKLVDTFIPLETSKE
ncbi:MAG: alpha-L-fucosidase [Bacteroidales bacterium]|jgi:alpha-L-fucosidase|nr:alpha-L-fucosidase [Bacteroidales bacterium]